MTLNAGQPVDNSPQRFWVMDVGMGLGVAGRLDLVQVGVGSGARVMQWNVRMNNRRTETAAGSTSPYWGGKNPDRVAKSSKDLTPGYS